MIISPTWTTVTRPRLETISDFEWKCNYFIRKWFYYFMNLICNCDVWYSVRSINGHSMDITFELGISFSIVHSFNSNTTMLWIVLAVVLVSNAIKTVCDLWYCIICQYYAKCEMRNEKGWKGTESWKRSKYNNIITTMIIYLFKFTLHTNTNPNNRLCRFQMLHRSFCEHVIHWMHMWPLHVAHCHCSLCVN